MTDESTLQARRYATSIRALKKLRADCDTSLQADVMADDELVDIVNAYLSPTADYQPTDEQECLGESYAPLYRTKVVDGRQVVNDEYEPDMDICGRQCPYGLWKSELAADEIQGNAGCYLLKLFCEQFSVPLAPPGYPDYVLARVRLMEAIPDILDRAFERKRLKAPLLMDKTHVFNPETEQFVEHDGNTFVYSKTTGAYLKFEDGTHVLKDHCVEAPAPPAAPAAPAAPAPAVTPGLPAAPAAAAPALPTSPTPAVPAAPAPAATPALPSAPGQPALPPTAPASAVPTAPPASPAAVPTTDSAPADGIVNPTPDVMDAQLTSLLKEEASFHDFISTKFDALVWTLYGDDGVARYKAMSDGAPAAPAAADTPEAAPAAAPAAAAKPAPAPAASPAMSDDEKKAFIADMTAKSENVKNFAAWHHYEWKNEQGPVYTKDAFKQAYTAPATDDELKAMCLIAGIDFSTWPSGFTAKSAKLNLGKMFNKQYASDKK